LLDGIAFAVQAISSIPAHFSVASSVYMFILCRIRASCFSRSMDLDAI